MIDTGHLQSIADTAEKNRKIQEAALALVFGSLVLLLFVFVAHWYAPGTKPEETPVVVGETRPDPFQNVTLTAKAAIVYDLVTGVTLFEQNSESQLPLASLTKLLTLYGAASIIPPGAEVPITETALSEEGDSGFSAGESFTFSDLAALALVASSNDAAEAIRGEMEKRRPAEGSRLLASAAEAAGLSATYALNGTGLDESESVSGAYGSAKDVALLAGELLKAAPRAAQATTRASLTVSSVDGTSHSFENTNQDVERIPGILLSKTGYTDLAGGNLVIVFDAGIGHPIAIVALGSTRETRFTDVDRLFDATRARFALDAL